MLGFIVAILLFFTLSKDPLQTFLNFIIGGIVPGIDVSLGFVPSLSLIVALLYAVYSITRQLKHQKIVQETRLNKLENEKKEFSEANSGERIKKHASVIAARSLTPPQ